MDLFLEHLKNIGLFAFVIIFTVIGCSIIFGIMGVIGSILGYVIDKGFDIIEKLFSFVCYCYKLIPKSLTFPLWFCLNTYYVYYFWNHFDLFTSSRDNLLFFCFYIGIPAVNYTIIISIRLKKAGNWKSYTILNGTLLLFWGFFKDISMRKIFGTLDIKSPDWESCRSAWFDVKACNYSEFDGASWFFLVILLVVINIIIFCNVEEVKPPEVKDLKPEYPSRVEKQNNVEDEIRKWVEWRATHPPVPTPKPIVVPASTVEAKVVKTPEYFALKCPNCHAIINTGLMCDHCGTVVRKS